MTNTSKFAVITGASAGMGAEFACQLAGQGYSLLLIARRQDRLATLAGDLSARYGVEVEIHPADLSNPVEVGRLAGLLEQKERVDLLVNNAGFGLVGLFGELGRDEQLEMLQVHATTSTCLTHAVLPGMLARRQGGIIQVASVAAFLPGKRSVMYNATKSYLVAFCESLQAELKGSGVHIQALCPGFTLTEFHDTAQLSGFKRSAFPGWVWMKAADVVRDSLQALRRGSGVVVPGLGYRLIVLLMRSAIIGSTVRKIICG